jgi:hypothetical protein
MSMKSWQLWAIAVTITLASAVYQRLTGPTWPLRGSVQLEGTEVRFRLPRSHAGDSDAEVRLKVPAKSITGMAEFRRYKSNDLWTPQPMAREGEELVLRLPHQPKAGKVMYRVRLAGTDGGTVELTPDPVVIRFRGEVPAVVMIPHILAMFLGMLFSNMAALEALAGGWRARRLTAWTLYCILIGGLILGPVVQKYAFDSYWTGWPFGQDLTDNKTAVIALAWVLALWRTRKSPPARAWVLTAAAITMTVYLIPHSVLGSELDYTAAAK